MEFVLELWLYVTIFQIAEKNLLQRQFFRKQAIDN